MTSRLCPRVGFFALWLIVGIAGCGGPHLPEPRPVVEADDEPQPAPPQVVVAAQPVAAPAAPPPAAPRVEHRYPDDPAAWTPADCLAAHREGRPALRHAVAHLVQKAPDARAIELLCRLLQPPSLLIGELEKSPPQAPQAAAAAAPAVPGLAPLILPVLAASAEPQARETLRGVLCGTVPTELPDSEAAAKVCQALAAHPAAFNEHLLGELLTAPQNFRPADGPLPAVQLQQLALRSIQQSASWRLRVRLAEHLVLDTTPDAHRELLGPLLAAPQPENLPAQTILYRAPQLSPAAREAFLAHFAQHAPRVVDHLLAVGPRPGSTPSRFGAGGYGRHSVAGGTSGGLFVTPTAEAQQDLPIAEFLYGDEFVAQLATEFGQVDDLGLERQRMLLACNLPRSEIRARLHDALQRQWREAAAPFQRAGLTFESIRDPGFLLLAKVMPRQLRRPGATAAATRGAPDEERARLSWQTATEQFVRELNGRFGRAARQPAGEHDASATAESRGDMSSAWRLELPRNMRPAAEYRLRWPEELDEKLPIDAPVVSHRATGGPSPLIVHYLRLEGEERMGRAVEHYQRQLRLAATHPTASGAWLDLVEHDSQAGRTRSIDVIIERLSPRPVPATASEPLKIEVLLVEIPSLD